MSKIDKIEELQNLLREDSQNFQARRQLAVLLTDCGFNEEALKNLIWLSKTFSDDSGIFYNLGIVYEKLKNLKKAKESYQKAIEIEPEAIDAVYNLRLVCTDLKEFNTAIKCFEASFLASSEEFPFAIYASSSIFLILKQPSFVSKVEPDFEAIR